MSTATRPPISALDVDTVGRTLGDHARRPAGHALQARRRAVRRDRAGSRSTTAAPRTISAKSSCAAATARWCSSPTWSGCEESVAPQGAQPLQPAALGHHHGHPGAGLRARRGARLSAIRPRQRPARERADRLCRPSRGSSATVQHRSLRHLPAGAGRSSTSCWRRSSRASSTRSSSCSRCRSR